MTLTDIVLIAILPVLLAISACCSAIETALFSLTHNDRAVLRRTAPSVSAAAAALLAAPRSLIIAILLANISANAAYMAAGSILVKRAQAGALELAIGLAIPLLLIVSGEVLPKSIAASQRVLLCRLLVPPLTLWSKLIWPIRVFTDTILITPIARLLRPDGDQSEPVTAEELAQLLEHSGATGAIDREEQELLEDVVALGSLRVRDVMTPRVDIDFIEHDASIDDLIALIKRHGHTKFPVCRGGLDGDLLGFLSAKRYFAIRERAGGGIVPIEDATDPIRYVPERARLDQLLEHFRSTNSHVALTVDEHGTVTGLVEVEDAIREIIEVSGAAGSDSDSIATQTAPGRWEISGRMNIRDWPDLFGSKALERGGARTTTVAGFIVAALGRLPKVHDEVRLGNVLLRVEAVERRSVQRVSVSLSDATAPAGAPRP